MYNAVVVTPQLYLTYIWHFLHAGPREERMMTTGLHLVSGKIRGVWWMMRLSATTCSWAMLTCWRSCADYTMHGCMNASWQIRALSLLVVNHALFFLLRPLQTFSVYHAQTASDGVTSLHSRRAKNIRRIRCFDFDTPSACQSHKLESCFITKCLNFWRHPNNR